VGARLDFRLEAKELRGAVVIPEPQQTKFGRLYAPDPRDMQHPMRASAAAAALRLERTWKAGPVRDQGDTPSCVGFTGQHFLEAAPIMARRGRHIPGGMELYKGAQKHDEWPGENYAGSSGRGLMKFMQSIGLISEYVWAPNIETLRNFILTRGPVCVGSEWFGGMSAPKLVEGRYRGLYLEPGGVWEGGHETLWIGYSRPRHAFRVLNSWGDGWAEKGRAWIDFDVANHLIFGMNGDAVSALEVE
jgi:hypothetical protein